MKTNVKSLRHQNGIFRLGLIVFIGLMSFQSLTGQEKIIFNHDYLMPEKGKSMLEFYSGIPYIGIGQYTYGFSNRFSAGVFYGLTPIAQGYGIRIKAVLAQPSETFRINLKSPFIYYPKMESGEGDPWVLAWPTVNAEWKLKNGARIWTGVGIIGAACTEFIFKPKEGKVMPAPEGTAMPKTEPMASLFNTFQFGYSKPVSNRLSYVIEVAPVMKGFKLKPKSGFLDAIPVIVTAGLSYSF